MNLQHLLHAFKHASSLYQLRFVFGISILFKGECYVLMQIQCTKNLNPERFELGTTLSEPIRSIVQSERETNIANISRISRGFRRGFKKFR